MRQLGIHALLVVLGTCTILPQETMGKSFTFAARGDAPYLKNHDMERISSLIKNINEAEPAFSIFVGDIKDGSSPWSDEIYHTAMKRFNQMEPPLVYISGDMDPGNNILFHMDPMLTLKESHNTPADAGKSQ